MDQISIKKSLKTLKDGCDSCPTCKGCDFCKKHIGCYFRGKSPREWNLDEINNMLQQHNNRRFFNINLLAEKVNN